VGRLPAVPRQRHYQKLVAMGAVEPQKAQALVVVLALTTPQKARALVIVLALCAPWATLLSSAFSVKLQLAAGVAKRILLLGSAALHSVATAGLRDAKAL